MVCIILYKYNIINAFIIIMDEEKCYIKQYYYCIYIQEYIKEFMYQSYPIILRYIQINYIEVFIILFLYFKYNMYKNKYNKLKNNNI